MNSSTKKKDWRWRETLAIPIFYFLKKKLLIWLFSGWKQEFKNWTNEFGGKFWFYGFFYSLVWHRFWNDKKGTKFLVWDDFENHVNHFNGSRILFTFLLAQEQKKSVMKDKAQALECVNLIKMFVQLTSGMQAFYSIGNLFYSTFSCPTLLSHA